MSSTPGRSAGFANKMKQSIGNVVIGLSILNIIFAAAMAGVVASQLDYQSQSPYCYLNVSGQVCIFTYITAGEIMLFALSLIIPLAIVGFKRRGTGNSAPIIGVYFAMSLFSFFWQLVMCITITIRGGQASDAGVPGQGARTSALAFAWLGTALTVVTAVVILLDLIRQKRQTPPEAAASPLKPHSTAFDSSETSSNDAAFKSV